MTNPKGAGRPLEFGEPTVRHTFRLPVSKSDEIIRVINRYLKKYRINKNK